jgi:hypothetical protein
MSGYDAETGIFELTATKASLWFRRTTETVPKDCLEPPPKSDMQFYARLFKHFGHQVIKCGPNYLRVKATPEQAWEVLSGLPSDPKRAAYHYQK